MLCLGPLFAQFFPIILEVASPQQLSKVPGGARGVDLKPAELECSVSSRLEPSGEWGWGGVGRDGKYPRSTHGDRPDPRSTGS